MPSPPRPAAFYASGLIKWHEGKRNRVNGRGNVIIEFSLAKYFGGRAAHHGTPRDCGDSRYGDDISSWPQ